VQTAVCLQCSGSGQTIEAPCPDCGGAGRRVAERKVTVRIPGGIDSGQRVRVSGRGGAGERGAAAGDLYVRVTVAPHDLFERRDDDVLYQVDLTMVQAAVGATVTVPTLDGDEEMTFEPGTQPGEIRVLRGRGLKHLNGHGRGNQEVTVRVLVPHDLDDQQRQLLLDFDSACGPDNYAERPEGVLNRLRSLFR